MSTFNEKDRPRDADGKFGSGGGSGGGNSGGGAGGEGESDEPKKGPFGPIFAGYKNKPEAAIDKIMAEKNGEVPDAFIHPDLGPIAFVYGNEHMGLRHIEAKRGIKWVQRIPDILRHGRIERDPKVPRVYVVRDGAPGHVAVIRLDWDGSEKTWLVTAYPDSEGKFGGASKTSSTAAHDGPVPGNPSRAPPPRSDFTVPQDGAQGNFVTRHLQGAANPQPPAPATGMDGADAGNFVDRYLRGGP